MFRYPLTMITSPQNIKIKLIRALQGRAKERREAVAFLAEGVRLVEEALAAEALRVFDARNIADLIVVNAQNEPVGLVDSQDLPKLKVM